MPETIRVRPAEGRRVRDPETGRVIPDDGANFSPSSYWFRRVRCGDVTIETSKSAPSKKAARNRSADAEE